MTQKNQKILIIEDQDCYRNFLAKTLEKLSKNNNLESNVDSASSEKEGLEYLANNFYDFVFTDGCLYGTDSNPSGDDWAGKYIAKEAKLKGMYIIGISSNPEKFKEIAGENLNLNYKKPFFPRELEYILLNKPSQENFDSYRNERRFE